MCQPKDSIVVCMGSSCFSRGNNRSAEALLAFIRERGLEDDVQVTGTLCQNACRQGPNLTLDGECHCGVDADALLRLLEARYGVPR